MTIDGCKAAIKFGKQLIEEYDLSYDDEIPDFIWRRMIALYDNLIKLYEEKI